MSKIAYTPGFLKCENVSGKKIEDGQPVVIVGGGDGCVQVIPTEINIKSPIKTKLNILWLAAWREFKDAFPFLFCKRIHGIVHTPYEMANRIIKTTHSLDCVFGYRNVNGKLIPDHLAVFNHTEPARDNPNPVPWKEYAAYTGFGLFCFVTSYLVIQAVALAIVKYKTWVFSF